MLPSTLRRALSCALRQALSAGRNWAVLFVCAALLTDISASAREPVLARTPVGPARHPAVARTGMVNAQEPLATEVGLAVLKKGGNAVDAPLGMGFALAATHPL